MTNKKRLKVCIDFDNSFYTANRDVDDGLALLYLLGSPDVELVGITSTFGNKGIDQVDQDTRRMLDELGLAIPYCKGGSHTGDYLNPASMMLVELAKQYQGELCVLATGSLTNLQGASLIDPNFYQRVQQVVVMGGTTEALAFSKQEMLELNFSCDPQAAYSVLTQAENLSIMTGNNCLDLLFTREQALDYLGASKRSIAKLILTYADPWFTDNKIEYGIKGFYNWDALAAALLVHPEYFKSIKKTYTVSVEGLSRGKLHCPSHDPTSYVEAKPYQSLTLNTPKIAQPEALKGHLYETWLNVDMANEKEMIK